ncbi:putative P-loop containing nucleoside triphosphate hydrolase [Helianthus debilis subsp. tardiflorus]
MDRIVEVVRTKPSSVIVLSDIDEADALVRSKIKRAMESQRIMDSHGREVSLGNVVFFFLFFLIFLLQTQYDYKLMAGRRATSCAATLSE